MILKIIMKKGKTYKIRKISIGDEIKVQIFDQKTGKPVWATYSTNSETANDAYRYGYDLVKELVQIAEDDFFKIGY